MEPLAKRCPKCDARIKFRADDKIAHCKVCKQDFAISHDDKKERTDVDSYTLTQTTTIVTIVSRIALAVMLVASLIMIGFAIYGKERITDGLEERDSSYKTEF